MSGSERSGADPAPEPPATKKKKAKPEKIPQFDELTGGSGRMKNNIKADSVRNLLSRLRNMNSLRRAEVPVADDVEAAQLPPAAAPSGRVTPLPRLNMSRPLLWDYSVLAHAPMEPSCFKCVTSPSWPLLTRDSATVR